ncbi:MAG: hypothetical protein GXX85_05705 [Ignavibacteria bacterium]|nr:hypothetical protein [Ignavibacteria bacterium]
MFEKELKYIDGFNASRIKKLGNFLTYGELAAANLHPAVLRYISAEIDYIIYNDRKKITRDSVFSYSGREINELFIKMAEIIKRDKKFSSDFLSETAQKASNFNMNFLIQPKTTLLKFVFGDASEMPVAEIQQSLNYLYYYDYINSVFQNYFSKKRVLTVSAEDFEDLLIKIQQNTFKKSSSALISNMLVSIGDFFNIGSVDKAIVPINAVQIYFHELGQPKFEKRIDDFRKREEKGNLKIEDIVRILFSESAVGIVKIEDVVPEKPVEPVVPVDDETAGEKVLELVAEMKTNAPVEEKIEDEIIQERPKISIDAPLKTENTDNKAEIEESAEIEKIVLPESEPVENNKEKTIEPVNLVVDEVSEPAPEFEKTELKIEHIVEEVTADKVKIPEIKTESILSAKDTEDEPEIPAEKLNISETESVLEENLDTILQNADKVEKSAIHSEDSTKSIDDIFEEFIPVSENTIRDFISHNEHKEVEIENKTVNASQDDIKHPDSEEKAEIVKTEQKAPASKIDTMFEEIKPAEVTDKKSQETEFLSKPYEEEINKSFHSILQTDEKTLNEPQISVPSQFELENKNIVDDKDEIKEKQTEFRLSATQHDNQGLKKNPESEEKKAKMHSISELKEKIFGNISDEISAQQGLISKLPDLPKETAASKQHNEPETFKNSPIPPINPVKTNVTESRPVSNQKLKFVLPEDEEEKTEIRFFSPGPKQEEKAPVRKLKFTSNGPVERRLKASKLVLDKRINKILEVIFDNDMDDFAGAIDLLAECPSPGEAHTLIDMIAGQHRLDTSQREVDLFKKLVNEYFI